MSGLAFIVPPFPLYRPRPPSNLSPPRMSTATPGNPSAAPQDHHLGVDWRAFRAHLVSTHRPQHHLDAMPPVHWAHLIPQLEVGCTLIANPSHTWPESFSHLNRAVFLITHITPSAISGLLLNRPTRFKVAEHKSVLARVGHEFSTNPVNLGGDSSTGTLEVLHSFPPDVCPGATHIVSGLYRGGFNSARKLVQQNLASPHDFQFFVAYSRWTWEQFSAEMNRDAWILASCSPNLMLLGARSDIWRQVNSALEST